MQSFEVNTMQDWQPVADAVMQLIGSGVRHVLLEGNLGAGKTTFVQIVVKKLGSNDPVQSPTYSLVNQYRLNNGMSIYHLDLYRVKSVEELMEAGIMDVIDSGALCLIEWGELLVPFVSSPFVVVQIGMQENGTRSITLHVR